MATPEPKKRAPKNPPPKTDRKNNYPKTRKSPEIVPDSSIDEIEKFGILAVCHYLGTGESAHALCRDKGWAIGTLLGWINRDETRRTLYSRAREDRADVMFERLNELAERAEISDPTRIPGMRLKMDIHKWTLARMHRKFAEKVTVSGDEEAPLVVNHSAIVKVATDAELEALISKLTSAAAEAAKAGT